MKKTAIALFLAISTAFCTAQTSSTNPGVLSTDQQESPAGAGNGIVMSMRQCGSQAHVCQILAPALYSRKEVQPWGVSNVIGLHTQFFGPKGGDPVGCISDYRFGGPQVLCNGGLQTPYGYVVGPMFSMNSLSSTTAAFAPFPAGLLVVDSVFAGSSDFYNNENSSTAFRVMHNLYTPSTSQSIQAIQRMYSTGDNIGMILGNYGVGSDLVQNEGHELVHGRAGEMAEVYDATVGTYSCASSGDCTFGLSPIGGISTFAAMGESLPLIDLTAADTSGYVANINNSVVTGSSGVDWSTYGTSTVTTTTAGYADSGANTFPRTGQTISVASSSGFSAGQTVCLFDALNPTWMCTKITAVGSGTITLAVMHYPLNSGSTVATGGLTGYGFSLDADSTTGSNGKAVEPDDRPLSGVTIRTVYPVIGSNSSAKTLQIMSGMNGAGNAPLQTYAYSHMGGSGGSVTVAVSGGAAASCSASGGTGYVATGWSAPPQIALTASPAWTAYPVLTVSDAGGVLNGCTVVSAGTQGPGGTLSASIVPTNGYHLFSQARVWKVYNPATGGVDGTAVQTMPAAGTFTAGDSVEQAHYFAHREVGLNLDNWTYQAAGTHVNLFYSTNGNFGYQDYEAQFMNNSAPTVYAGYPAGATPWAIGSAGTYLTPYGLTLGGPHANGVWMQMPPYGAGYPSAMAALFVDCWNFRAQSYVCNKWNRTYPVLGVRNQNANNHAYDMLGYNPVSTSWTMTAGATNFTGQGASCTYSFGPKGFSESGPGCSGSPAPGAANPGGQSNLSATTGRIGGSPLAAGACASVTVNIPGATMSMAVVATPSSDPGDGIFWQGFVRAPGNVVVKVCAAIAEIPNASVYNVRVIP